jgi:pre-mRNA-splicing factor SYF1
MTSRSGRRESHFGVKMTKRQAFLKLKLACLTRTQVAETYTRALQTINPRKATANLHRLYVNFAKFYEEGGSSGSAEPDLDSARKILERATKVNFKAVEDLADIWCEWSEMELRHE